MIDQRAINLPAVVQRHFQPALRRLGREWRGPCPLHRGTNPTTFALWQEEDGSWVWHCFAGCGGGDAIALVQQALGLSFPEALAWLELPQGEQTRMAPPPRRHPPPPRPPTPAAPPPIAWQQAAAKFVRDGQRALWADETNPALTWLRGRGFTDATIRQAQLGFHPHARLVLRSDWGLESAPAEGRAHTSMLLPGGLIIPWLVDGAIWKVVIRRLGPPRWRAPLQEPSPARDHPLYRLWQALSHSLDGQLVDALARELGWSEEAVQAALAGLAAEHLAEPLPAYHTVAGSGNPLYNADAFQPGRPAILCEGALDALAVQQEAGDLVTAVASGTTGARRERWALALTRARPLLLAHDRDGGGEAGIGYWQRVIPDALPWRPLVDDPATMLRLQATGEADLRLWALHGLQYAGVPVLALGHEGPLERPRGEGSTPPGHNHVERFTHPLGPRLAPADLTDHQWLFVRSLMAQQSERHIDALDQPYWSLRYWCERRWRLNFDALVTDPRAMPSDLAGWRLHWTEAGWVMTHRHTGRATKPQTTVSGALRAAIALDEHQSSD